MDRKGRIVAGLVIGGLVADAAYAYTGTEPPDHKKKHTPPAQTIILGTATDASSSAAVTMYVSKIDMVGGRMIDVPDHRATRPSAQTPAEVVRFPTFRFEVDRG